MIPTKAALQHYLLVLLAVAGITQCRAATRAQAAPAEQVCETYVITAYAAESYPGWTADGSTTTWGALNRGEPIAAASRNVPFNAYVQVVGLGSYRVADRGNLGARHIDVLVSTHREAVNIGRSERTVCIYV
jgi:3D (Asp-Asp-Asp) domain-containing protein